MRTRGAFILFLAGMALLPMKAFSANVVGYVNEQFGPGDTLFGNPLLNTFNDLNHLFDPTYVPQGTTISLWDATSHQWAQSSTFLDGTWSVDLELNPGTGALLHTSALFVNTFVGTVLNADGSPYDGNGITPPPPFAGPNGTYLWSSKVPAQFPGIGPVWNYIVGRDPHEGEQFSTLTSITTFTHGAWDNGDPFLNVGQAAFFNIGPSVPEPSVAGLVIGGVVTLWASGRARRGRL
jgi:hypothetical protein